MAIRNVVYKQIIWDRLIAIVEEQAQTIIRTAFGTAAREAGDVSAGVFSPEGKMLAQAITGTPGHVNSVANSIPFFIKEFPIETMQPGDVYITNDPWKSTGHLYDITVVSPVFYQNKVICLVASNTHVVDIGGMGVGPDATQIYQEGLFIPIVKLYDAGQPTNVKLFIEANVRFPLQTIGDVDALVASNEVASQNLQAICKEYDLPDLAEEGQFILETSVRSMQQAIRRLPKGTWHHEMDMDDFLEPIHLEATLTINEDSIEVDLTGTSKQIKKALNVPLSYTQAYATFGIRCIVGPDIPNNTGSLSVISITAPEGCILNAQYPAAVTTRATTGMMLPDLIYGCLRQVIPDQVPAESTDCLWNIRLVGNGANQSGEHHLSDNFTQVTFTNGGIGARPNGDGLSTTAFPSGVRNTSIEMIESIAPLRFWRKEFRCDSGGAGKYRGGLGQIVEVENTHHENMKLAATFNRVKHPPKGVFGGLDGKAGKLYLTSGKTLEGYGGQEIPGDSRVIFETPGGAGYGDPSKRSREMVRQDLENGLISEATARDVYKYNVEE